MDANMETNERNFRITIEYDGTAYHGWQRQKDRRSIQGEIEKALEKLTSQKVTLIGSGRTDAGVHALGQIANYRCRTRMSARAFEKGLNSLLPEDIVIRACREVDESFHARYDAVGKRYRYCILNRPTPAAVGRQYAWYLKKPLDVAPMESAASRILGKHDFKAFEGTGSPRSHTIRTVVEAKWRKAASGLLVFEIEADGFLRFMVRNIVGSLVDVGQGKKTPDDFEAILNARDRSLAGITAPPQGLFLLRVKY